jgi:hypothetical protein
MLQVETFKNYAVTACTVTTSSATKPAFAVLLTTALLVCGCSPRYQQAINTDDYVQVDNPFSADSSDPNAKIWVPRKSVEHGPPRGTELVKKGYEKLVGTSDETATFIDAAKPPVGAVRTRLLVAVAGEQSIGAPLRRFLSQGSIVRGVDSPTSNELINDQEEVAFIATIANQTTAGPILFISKPDGIKPGGRIKADLYDTRGPLLIRSFWVAVPQPGKDQSSQDALLSALKGLSDAALASLGWFPWYGRVISVSGERIYVDAGAESGIKVGQRVFVYRGGEAVKGIGFAPGKRVTAFPITELFGEDGSYGVSPEAAEVRPGDYVELEK